MEWLLAHLVSSFDFINQIAQWGQDHVLAAVFFGMFFMKVADYIVRKTPTKYDDMTLEILEDAFKSAWGKAQEVKGKLASKKGK